MSATMSLEVPMIPARLRDDGAVELPDELRGRKDLRPGAEFSVLERGNLIILVPVVPMESLVGLARGADTENYRDRNDRT